MIRVVIGLSEELEELLIRALHEAGAVQFVIHRCQGPKENGDRHRALAVEAQSQIAGLARFELHPGAAIGDQLGRGQAPTAILFHAEIHARGANQLADHDALRAVDDKGRILRHLRQITQEDFLLDDLARLADQQGHVHIEGDGVGEVPIQAFLLGILGLAKTIFEIETCLLSPGTREIQAQQAIVALDGRDLVEQ